ncbi:aspartate kinase [Intestinibacter sp.]|uniref:aspartate kinase n=1 Tax=Intestinibacter sp. TaxID=1965304 RepID=UPI002A7556F7|nr:aspartate kinase [Intestinibacter sp.]MDY2735959.1 aspartate kinase [Intestinibacter sp.]MDY4574785.1 aspartate kinase [Intestinibacter sp.]
MGVLVQKFGGTSVASYEKMKEVCKIIEAHKEQYKDIAVVVSAMGRKGAPYATDTLIGMCTNINDRPTKRELDMIMSCGEIISGTILATMLDSMGIPATFLTGIQAGITTTKAFSNAKIKKINPKKIQKELADGKVVIIAGFQGGTEDGEITTLGRGGSDTSAVAIGKALGSDLVQIYTDVDGIMTADPRIEPDAKVLKYVDYDEVFQMAEKGAKVIHPRAVELAKNADIILQIKNTYNPSYEGTKIGPANVLKDVYEDSSKVKFMSAVAHKDKIAQVKVIANEIEFSKILNEMEDRHINMDMINFFTEKKAFALDVNNLEEVENIIKKYNVEYEIKSDCAKVTLIGNKVTETPGVIAKIMRALNAENVTLLQSSDSYNSLSCLVDEKDMVTTVHVIHNAFSAQ